LEDCRSRLTELESSASPDRSLPDAVTAVMGVDSEKRHAQLVVSPVAQDLAMTRVRVGIIGWHETVPLESGAVPAQAYGRAAPEASTFIG
jgi:hypothetical protein